MDKIKTTDCYVPTKELPPNMKQFSVQLWNNLFWTSIEFEKKEGVIVLTVEEFEAELTKARVNAMKGLINHQLTSKSLLP